MRIISNNTYPFLQEINRSNSYLTISTINISRYRRNPKNIPTAWYVRKYPAPARLPNTLPSILLTIPFKQSNAFHPVKNIYIIHHSRQKKKAYNKVFTLLYASISAVRLSPHKTLPSSISLKQILINRMISTLFQITEESHPQLYGIDIRYIHNPALLRFSSQNKYRASSV